MKKTTLLFYVLPTFILFISCHQKNLDFLLRARRGRLQCPPVGSILLGGGCSWLSALVPAICLDWHEFHYHLSRRKHYGRIQPNIRAVRWWGRESMVRSPCREGLRRFDSHRSRIVACALVRPFPLPAKDLHQVLVKSSATLEEFEKKQKP